jgi:hypothetical protein
MSKMVDHEEERIKQLQERRRNINVRKVVEKFQQKLEEKA